MALKAEFRLSSPLKVGVFFALLFCGTVPKQAPALRGKQRGNAFLDTTPWGIAQ